MVIVPDHGPVDGYPFPVKSIVFSNGKNRSPELNFNFPCFTTHPQSTTTFYALTDGQIENYISAWRRAMNSAVKSFNPDIIHVQHVWLTAFVAQEIGIPFIASCHGTDLMGFNQGPRYRDKTLIGARAAHDIIAISHQVMADAINTYGIDESKVSLIWNGFDTECFHVIHDATKEAVLGEFNLAVTDKPLVSFVGKFARFKGIDVLLRAASIYEKQLPGVQTLLVGHGELFNEMRTLCDSLALCGVRFLGHQPQSVVARIYNAADVSVVPSRVEPFGLVAVEALACATPVVATNAGGLPDFITSEVGALVPCDDHESLAESFVNELTNTNRIEKGAFASKYAFDGFTWRRQVEKMTRLYGSALAE